jgi:serine/threonine protein kinase
MSGVVRNGYGTADQDATATSTSWRIGRVLGQGHFACAFTVTNLATNTQCAGKVITKSSLRVHAPRQERLQIEIQIHELLSNTHHPNLLRLISRFQDPEHIVMVTPLCVHGDLKQLQDRRGTLTHGEVRSHPLDTSYTTPSGEVAKHCPSTVHRETNGGACCRMLGVYSFLQVRYYMSHLLAGIEFMHDRSGEGRAPPQPPPPPPPPPPIAEASLVDTNQTPFRLRNGGGGTFISQVLLTVAGQ